jgi:ribosomal protein L29
MTTSTDLLNLIASLATGLTEAKASLATAQQHLEDGWKRTHELTIQLNQLKAELAKLTSSQQRSGPTSG